MIKGYLVVVDYVFFDEFVLVILELYFKEFDDFLRLYFLRFFKMENIEFLYVRIGES